MYVCVYMYVCDLSNGAGGVAANNAQWAMYQNSAMAGVAGNNRHTYTIHILAHLICMYVGAKGNANNQMLQQVQQQQQQQQQLLRKVRLTHTCSSSEQNRTLKLKYVCI